VLATGGTAAAACALLAEVGAQVVGFGALLALDALAGRAALGSIPVHVLLHG
jgi:adenine phosphoribosyltransferase